MRLLEDVASPHTVVTPHHHEVAPQLRFDPKSRQLHHLDGSGWHHRFVQKNGPFRAMLSTSIIFHDHQGVYILA